jgi:hypothetical protein
MDKVKDDPPLPCPLEVAARDTRLVSALRERSLCDGADVDVCGDEDSISTSASSPSPSTSASCWDLTFLTMDGVGVVPVVKACSLCC